MRVRETQHLGWSRDNVPGPMHEYSVLHMVLRIRICIHLKTLIKMLDLKRRGWGFCQKPLKLSSFTSLERNSESEKERRWIFGKGLLKCGVTCNKTQRSFYLEGRENVMSHHVKDH